MDIYNESKTGREEKPKMKRGPKPKPPGMRKVVMTTCIEQVYVDKILKKMKKDNYLYPGYLIRDLLLEYIKD